MDNERPISDFGTEELFGLECLAPDNLEENRRGRCQKVGQLQVLIETRGSANGPRNRHPDGLMVCRCPK